METYEQRLLEEIEGMSELDGEDLGTDQEPLDTALLQSEGTWKGCTIYDNKRGPAFPTRKRPKSLPRRFSRRRLVKEE